MFGNVLNELEALEAIYEELSYQQNFNDSSIKGSIEIEVKLEHFTEFIIKFKEETFKIKHLPTLNFHFGLHNNSDFFFNMDCIWLSEAFKTLLSDKMNTMKCEEGTLWCWIQFLELESLNYLFKKNNDDIVEVDVNSINCEDGDDLFGFLIKYDGDKERSLFNDSIMICESCMVSKRGMNCIRLRHCGDAFCAQCAAGYFNTRIKSGDLKLECLICGGEVDYDEIKHVLDKDAFDRWDQLVFNHYLKTTDTAKSCPRCTTMSVVEEGYGLCPKCHFSFCSKCNDSYHVDPECGKEKQRQKLEEEVKELKKETVACPKCKEAYEKNGGCNKMICVMCGTYFCYLCEKRLDKVRPYEHFGLRPKCFL